MRSRPEPSLRRAAVSFLPRIDDARRTLETLARDAPLSSLFPVLVMRDGHVTAQAGPADQDTDRRIAKQLSDNIAFAAPFLAALVDRVRSQFQPTPEALLDMLGESPLFEEARRPLLSRGVEAFLAGDAVVSVHLLVPQIEHMLRRLLRLLGVPTDRPRRDRSGYQEKALRDVLREPALREVTDEDFAVYMQMLLADPLGWNVRNLVAHGLMDPDQFTRQVADRVFHVLLVLAQVRPAPPGGCGDRGVEEGQGG